MRCHHYCNEPLRCPSCIRRFWQWAERHTNSPPSKRRRSRVSFYDHVLPFQRDTKVSDDG